MTWAREVNNITDKLVALLKTIPDFENRVYKGYLVGLKAFPSILVHLTSVRAEKETYAGENFLLNYNVLVRTSLDVKADQEQGMSSFITLVGKVIDLFYANVNTADWFLLSIGEINLTFFSERSMVFFSALIPITIRKIWSE